MNVKQKIVVGIMGVLTVVVLCIVSYLLINTEPYFLPREIFLPIVIVKSVFLLMAIFVIGVVLLAVLSDKDE